VPDFFDLVAPAVLKQPEQVIPAVLQDLAVPVVRVGAEHHVVEVSLGALDRHLVLYQLVYGLAKLLVKLEAYT
jgi:hypothetical protein